MCAWSIPLAQLCRGTYDGRRRCSDRRRRPGLGWALAKRFSQEGLDVVCAARSTERLHALAKRDQLEAVRFHACDVAEAASVADLFATINESVGPPSVVVFNVGAFERGNILDLRPEDFERCWRVGCFGGFLVGQAAARLMVPRTSGTIIFTGATASLRGGAGFANLAVPKFGLRALAQSMARAWLARHPRRPCHH
jgi:NAD(P)-dependent dehydrogenase (short-subunit alcohol dehydrogenase family)